MTWHGQEYKRKRTEEETKGKREADERGLSAKSHFNTSILPAGAFRTKAARSGRDKMECYTFSLPFGSRHPWKRWIYNDFQVYNMQASNSWL